jgi:hypothetical protein
MPINLPKKPGTAALAVIVNLSGRCDKGIGVLTRELDLKGAAA